MMFLHAARVYVPVFLLVLLQHSNLFSRDLLATERQIDSCFAALQKINKQKIKADLGRYDWNDFYENKQYESERIMERIKAGATCYEYTYSEQLALMRKLYVLYAGEDTNYQYTLADENNYGLYDLKLYNCGGKVGIVEARHQDVVQSLGDSYRQWYTLLKKNGYKATMEQRIFPTSFSKCHWVKELGLVKGWHSNEDILHVAFQIISDSTYLRYYINRNGFKRFFEGDSHQEIVAELASLAIRNNYVPFTFDIMKFKLIATKEGNKAAFLKEFLQMIADAAVSKFDVLKWYNLSDKYGMMVVLR